MEIRNINTDLILSISATFISRCAFARAITEAQLMKVQTKARLYAHLDWDTIITE